MALLVVSTIFILPIALPLLLTEVSVTFWDIASGLVYLILVPLAVSLFVRARYPEAAALAQPLFAQASNLNLLFLLVLMVVLNFSDVVSLLGSGGTGQPDPGGPDPGRRLPAGQPGQGRRLAAGPGRRAA